MTGRRQAPGAEPWNTDTQLALDAGVRRLVTALNAHGFQTSDSGDGRSKWLDGSADETCLDIPHVAIGLKAAHQIIVESQRLLAVLDALALPGTEFQVQATYDPRDHSAVIMVYGLADGALRP